MFYLTEADLFLFREMAADYRARKRSTKMITPPLRSPQTPDVYLAKVPPGGIPALSQTETTGTGTDQPLDDVPGSVECEIYQLDTSSDTPSFGRVGELTYIVRNLSPSAISADTRPWVLVVRDKFGEWFVAGGGGSGEEIDFEDIQRTVEVITGVVQQECGLLFKRTPFTFTFTLPVGSDVQIAVGSGNTGTGSVDDGDDIPITFPTKLITLPAFPLTFTFDPVTCTGTIDTTQQQVCVFSGGLECCPDYTGTGTS